MRVARRSKPIKRNLSGISESDVIEPASPRAAASLVDSAVCVPPARPRGVSRRPSRVAGRARERRSYGRALLALPLQIRRVAGQRDMDSASLRTKNISSSGVYFLSPRYIEPGTPVELRVLLLDHPYGRPSVCMSTEAHVVRVEEASRRGWHGVAAAFDDISFSQTELVPVPRRAG